MITRLFLVFTLYFIVAALPSHGAPDGPLLENPTDWMAIGGSPASFHFQDGELRLEYGEAEPSAIITKASYENFELSFEFSYHQWAESGLYIHAPWNGAFEAGLEIELADHAKEAPDPYHAGAIHGYVAAKAMAVKPHGEWNTCFVRMNAPLLLVEINGLVVQDINLEEHPDLRYKMRQGAIGFQNNLGWGFHVRNLSLKPLPGSATSLPLFNGEDLSGWREVRKRDAAWSVEDGVIVAHPGNGYLQHVHPTQDFALSLYYKAGAAANGGVFFRWKDDDSDRGNEIQILDVPGITMPSGSIYSLARAAELPITPHQWSLLQIFVSGTECRTFLNGHPSARTDTLDKVWPGHITLQMHSRKAEIRFKEILLTPNDGG